MSEPTTTERGSFRVERENRRYGVLVRVYPFNDSPHFFITVSKDQDLGSDAWRDASVNPPTTQMPTLAHARAYGGAILLAATIGAELDAEFTN